MRQAKLNEQENRWEQYVPIKEYYTVQDVCIILDVGGPSVYGAIKRGTMRGVRINGVVHVRHEALLNYVSRRGSAPVFDPTQLIIEEIVPAAEAQTAADNMAGPAAAAIDDSMDFLDE